MRLKDYARNHKKRKDYVQQPGLLIVGVDVSKVKHDPCLGTQFAGQEVFQQVLNNFFYATLRGVTL